jgi:hypothetical protein
MLCICFVYANYKVCLIPEYARIKSFEFLDKTTPSPERGGLGEGLWWSKMYPLLPAGKIPLKYRVHSEKSING